MSSSHDSTTKWSQQRAKDYQAHPVDPQKVGLTSDEIGTRAVADVVSRDVPRDEIPAAMLHSSVAGSAAAAAGNARHAATTRTHGGAGMASAIGVGIDLDDRAVAASRLPTGSNAAATHTAAPLHGTHGAHNKHKGGIPVISNLTASDPARGLTAADLVRGDNIDTASRYSGVRTALAPGLAAAGAAPLAANACGCTGDLLPDHHEKFHSASSAGMGSRSCDCTGDLLPDHWQTHHASAIAVPLAGAGLAAAPASTYNTTSYGYAGDINSGRGQGPSTLSGNISPRARTDLTARDQIPDTTSSSGSSSSATDAPHEKKTLGQKIGAALGFGKKKRKNKKSKAAAAAAAAGTGAGVAGTGTGIVNPLATRKFGSDLTHDTNVVSGADMTAGQGLHREASLEPAPRRSVASEVGLNDPRATQAAIDALPSGINDIKIEGINKMHRRHESVAVAPAPVPAPMPVTETVVEAAPVTIVETQPAIAPQQMETVVGPATTVVVESIESGPARPIFHQPQAPLSERVTEYPMDTSSFSRQEEFHQQPSIQEQESFHQEPFMQGGQSYSSSTFDSSTFPSSSQQQQQQLPLGQSQFGSELSTGSNFSGGANTGALGSSSASLGQQPGNLRNQQF